MKYFHLSIYLICSIGSVHAQEFLREQSMQLSTIPFQKIEALDLVNNTRTVRLFDQGNKIREKITYKGDVQIQQETYIWKGSTITQYSIKQENYWEDQWLEMEEGSCSYFKRMYNPDKKAIDTSFVWVLKPNMKNVMGSDFFLLDKDYNVMALYRYDKNFNDIIYYLDPFGYFTKKVSMVEGKQVEEIMQKNKTGRVEEESTTGELVIKVIHSYDEHGLLLEEIMYTRNKEEKEFYPVTFIKYSYTLYN